MCKKGNKKISNIWSCLNSLNVVIDWVAWNPGRGSKIRIGEDTIVGTYGFYKLSEGLIRELNGRGIIFLCQAISHHCDIIVGEQWKLSTKLNL